MLYVRDMTQADLVRESHRVGAPMSIATVNAIVHDRAPISERTAAMLETVLGEGVPARFWALIQEAYEKGNDPAPDPKTEAPAGPPGTATAHSRGARQRQQPVV